MPNQKPSILIIAVESLGSEDFFCDEKESEFSSGLGLFCEDGVRFTHAYAPSTMSQATIASMLTGLYPKDTQVWHNGAQYLSEKFLTVQEVAYEKGYKTAFFSGGPPIWRKSGLDQGFELFEDNVSVSLRELYRPAKKNFELFLNWLKDSNDGRPFFSVIYLPDLQFPYTVTLSDTGQERALGVESQIKEVNESFAHFVVKMKQNKMWDNTYVILTGVSGRNHSGRENDISSVNLRSDATQILLMIKPVKKLRDDGTQWSIDANVSLIDLGATLFDLIDSAENIKSYDNQLEVVSFKTSLTKPVVDWSKNRWILLESAWANWRTVGLSRMALRQDHLLYVNDTNPVVYNSLSDRYETQPQIIKGAMLSGQYADFNKYFQNRSIVPWEGLPNSLVQKIEIFEYLHRDGFVNAHKLKLLRIAKQRPWDRQITGWLARIALREKNWQELLKLGEENYNSLWVYVAKNNLGEKTRDLQDSCWSLVSQEVKNFRHSQCEDLEFIAFLNWVKASDLSKKSALEEIFFRIHLLAEVDEQISAQNYTNRLTWDSALDIPGEPRLIHLILSMSEYKGFKQVLSQRTKQY